MATAAEDAALALALTRGIGGKRTGMLVAAFGSPLLALEATGDEWLEAANVNPRLRAGALSRSTERAVRKVHDDCRQLGIEILAIGTPAYPGDLATIADPPAVLYRLGTPIPWHEVFVAVVGTRRASSHGMAFAYRLAGDLSNAGVVVVSGLAIGIDAHAHEAVVAAGGRGVAVLAAGLDTIHPPVNRRLAAGICTHGCLLSEYPPGTRIRAGQFVGRNRIISGISQAVAIVEAGERSGALRTADFALEQERPLLVMPGRPGDPRVAGSLDLLRDGAALLLDASDVAGELKLSWSPDRTEFPELGGAGALLGRGGASFDALLAASGFSTPELLALLGRLELSGRVRRGNDGSYYPLSPRAP